MASSPLILGYAFGGGLGHLNRMVSLLKPFVAQYEVIILTNCPLATLYQNEGVNIHLYSSNGHPSARRLSLWLQSFKSLWQRAVCAVIDCFPSGVLGELNRFKEFHFNGCWVLIEREGQLKTFEESPPHYSISYATEDLEREILPCVEQRVTLANPPLMRDYNEILNREDACSALMIEPENTNVILYHSGPFGEFNAMLSTVKACWQTLINNQPEFKNVALRASCPCNRPANPDLPAIFPVLTYAAAFDGFISAAGFNSFSEIEASGKPAFRFPQVRSIDNQHKRNCSTSETDLATFLMGLVQQPVKDIEPFINGSHEFYNHLHHQLHSNTNSD